jgi:hypothetical protein
VTDLEQRHEVLAAPTLPAAVAVLVHAGCPEWQAWRIATLERGDPAGGDVLIDGAPVRPEEALP